MAEQAGRLVVSRYSALEVVESRGKYFSTCLRKFIPYPLLFSLKKKSKYMERDYFPVKATKQLCHSAWIIIILWLREKGEVKITKVIISGFFPFWLLLFKFYFMLFLFWVFMLVWWDCKKNPEKKTLYLRTDFESHSDAVKWNC